MSAKSKIVVGLEVGTSKVAALVGEIKPDGSIQLLGMGRAKSSKMRKGEINDFDDATACIYQALNEAELKSNVMINEVYLAVTGSHVTGFQKRGETAIVGEDSEVSQEDLEAVEESAKEAPIPAGDTLIHVILQHYYVDGKEGVRNPLGQLGNRLEADYLLVHGKELRLKNAIKCVKSTGVEVCDVVFSPVAAAQSILKNEDKRHGAIVIDMGGGTTDYAVYSNDALKHLGVIAVGGDHLINDISIGLRLTVWASEKVMIEHGSVREEDTFSEEMIQLKGEYPHEEWVVNKGALCTIMRARMEETFEILRDEIETKGLLPYLRHGVKLTGGCSQIKGIEELAASIFGLPVTGMKIARNSAAVVPVDMNPEYSVVVGLLKYAQKVEEERAWKTPELAFERISRRVMDFFHAVKSVIF
ncbi:cell division protein FtsA [Oscillatoria amoena NRMC-F 0135]|nr:cell division protein FtsA [Oscillatoria amoena NRMC-F 0135]